MPLKTIEINSLKITFDKNKTKEYRTDYNNTCDCQNCRNYYKNIESNAELLGFLERFGIDFNHAEEVFSWNSGDDKRALVHHEGYYGVFGKIEGEDFDLEKYGVKISFSKEAFVPCDRDGEVFWICISGDFPYVLNEEREVFDFDGDLPNFPSDKQKNPTFIKRVKSYFMKS